ncbi:3'-5'-exoribonuclease [Aureococcus anophagefferens]|nr:3'-5'-exoribonuclease [Aureococcus anophagefferens]
MARTLCFLSLAPSEDAPRLARSRPARVKVQAIVGATLERAKGTEQCSAWGVGARPLPDAWVAYAALDAYVCVLLHDSLADRGKRRLTPSAPRRALATSAVDDPERTSALLGRGRQRVNHPKDDALTFVAGTDGASGYDKRSGVVRLRDCSLGRRRWAGRVALGALVAAIFCCVLAFLRSRADPDPGAKASALEAPLLSEEPRASDAPDFAFLDAIRTKDFCILFVAFVCSSGPGLILINNLGQIVPAVPSLPEGTEDAFVSILSVCNCLGRLSAGALGDHLLAARARRGPRRSPFCALTAAAMGLLAIGTPASLYGAVVVGGYAYGGLNGGIVPCYSEIWGFASFASLYSAGSLAEGAASYLMATLLFGSLYQREIKSQGLAASATCVGRGCFLNAALVAAALAAFATLLCVVLAVRSRARYAALYPQFFRNLNGAIQ